MAKTPNDERFIRQSIKWVYTYLTTLTPSEVKVLLALLTYADKDTGVCYPSLESLMGLTGLASQTVRTAIKGLCTLDLVTVERKSRSDHLCGWHNEYTLALSTICGQTAAEKRKAKALKDC